MNNSAEARMTQSFLLSVVIPVYNGAESIERLVNALKDGLGLGAPFEVVLVNDGSRDQSDAACRRLAAAQIVPTTYINLTRNNGEHNAVMAGLAHARGDWIVTIDDDFQNPPSEVAKLVRFAQDSDHDVVYSIYKTRKHAFWRVWGSQFANGVAGVLMDKPKGFYLSSFRCMKQWVAQEVIRYTGPYPYIDGLILQVTQNLGQLEVEHSARAGGRSNYTLRRLVRLWLHLAVNFSIMPLRASTLLGLFMSAIGFLFFLYIIIDYLVHGAPVEGWASLMSAVALFAGAQLVMLGLIGEYVGRIHLTANGKPQYVVRDVQPHGDGKS